MGLLVDDTSWCIVCIATMPLSRGVIHVLPRGADYCSNESCALLTVNSSANHDTSAVLLMLSFPARHLLTMLMRLGFSSAAATLSLSFNCLFTASSVECVPGVTLMSTCTRILWSADESLIPVWICELGPGCNRKSLYRCAPEGLSTQAELRNRSVQRVY